MTVSICIGSSCHLKGSREIIATLQKLIAENDLRDKVLLRGTFCNGHCTKDVVVTIDNQETIYSVSPETAEAFFRDEILARLS